AELISSKNGKGKTPLQTLLFAKVEKKEHESENKIIKVVKATLKLLREYDDNTIECAVKLLMLGANINDLKLTIDKEEDKKYYHNFLKKLKKSVEESKDLDKTMKKGIIINIEKVISNEYPLHSAVKRQNLEEFSSFLKNGHNITVIDQERNNIIHKAALLPKRRKVKFLTKILNLVKENQIPEEDFKTAVNAQNSDNKTPMQVALSKKAKNNWKTYIPFKNNYTAEFCTMLLENGAEDKQLQSSVPSGQLSKRHYETVKEINRHYQTPTGNQIVKEYKRTHSKTFPIKTITTFLTLAIVSSIA
ncbi:MAG: hypothetical protein QWI73_03510, partial [Alphaproteobacteria bacterium]|nr:hypothetical protein [Alphaproteobacteria bacterium]